MNSPKLQMNARHGPAENDGRTTCCAASLSAFEAESQSLIPLYMLHVLQQMTFCEAPGWRIGERAGALRIAGTFTPLLTRWHQAIENEGWLEQRRGIWYAGECMPPDGAVEQRLDDGRHRLRQFLSGMEDGHRAVGLLFPTISAIESVFREPHPAGGRLFPDMALLAQSGPEADLLKRIAAALWAPIVSEA